MVSGGITKEGMSRKKIDQCGVCLRAKANSDFYMDSVVRRSTVDVPE